MTSARWLMAACIAAVAYTSTVLACSATKHSIPVLINSVVLSAMVSVVVILGVAVLVGNVEQRIVAIRTQLSAVDSSVLDLADRISGKLADNDPAADSAEPHLDGYARGYADGCRAATALAETDRVSSMAV